MIMILKFGIFWYGLLSVNVWLNIPADYYIYQQSHAVFSFPSVFLLTTDRDLTIHKWYILDVKTHSLSVAIRCWVVPKASARIEIPNFSTFGWHNKVASALGVLAWWHIFVPFLNEIFVFSSFVSQRPAQNSLFCFHIITTHIHTPPCLTWLFWSNLKCSLSECLWEFILGLQLVLQRFKMSYFPGFSLASFRHHALHV